MERASSATAQSTHSPTTTDSEKEHTVTMHTGASHNRNARISTIAMREARTLKREPGVERVTRSGHVTYRKGMNA